ncbi:MAG TPA: amidohydrolase family protein [Gemmatimonadaceae bacterium]|jgi:hypothetical protein
MTKLIGIEEHFLTKEIRAAWANSPAHQAESANFDRGEIESRLDDLGDGRIALMDEAGVDVQVLSVTTPALNNLEPDESVALACRTNDLLAETIAKHPTRYQGFATLPIAAPHEAASELERCVRQLGFVGTMLCGRVRDRNLDHADFRPVFEAASRLNIPILIHPQLPQRSVRDAYYSGFGDPIDTAFAAFGLGWHYEAGMQFLRLMLSGLFDEYPNLQLILGHWGEVVLFYADRIASMARVAKLERSMNDYLRENVYVTASGMWNETYLRRTVEIVGHERLLFSTDYPYQYRPGREARSFLEKLSLSPEQKELFAHGNWERLTSST